MILKKIFQKTTKGTDNIHYKFRGNGTLNFVINANFLNSTQNHLFNNIHTITDFHAILKRERFLSDRNNHGFSLITFNAKKIKKCNIIATQLAEIFATRLRITDTVGWVNTKSISVLLSNTDSKGAKKFADLLRSQITLSENTPLYDIYTYQSKKWHNGNGNKSINSFKDVVDEEYTMFPFEYKIPFWKRTMDIVCSFFGLLLLLPFLAFVALMIKIVSPGPIFYKQQRVGRSGKTFNFYKFRTMKMNNDITVHQKYLKELINGDSNRDKPMGKLEDDNNIIHRGDFLRKSCIDELPQLLNVLRGEMSLVGPRPCIPYEAEEYLSLHARRFYITPGMTGLWQVSGKNKRTFKEMIRMDIEYISKQSFWLDIMILLKTPLVILSEFNNISKKNKKNILSKKSNSYEKQMAGEMV